MVFFSVENEVDGKALLNLEEDDIFKIFEGKIGAARKIITLVKEVKVKIYIFILAILWNYHFSEYIVCAFGAWIPRAFNF